MPSPSHARKPALDSLMVSCTHTWKVPNTFSFLLTQNVLNFFFPRKCSPKCMNGFRNDGSCFLSQSQLVRPVRSSLACSVARSMLSEFSLGLYANSSQPLPPQLAIPSPM